MKRNNQPKIRQNKEPCPKENNAYLSFTDYFATLNGSNILTGWFSFFLSSGIAYWICFQTYILPHTPKNKHPNVLTHTHTHTRTHTHTHRHTHTHTKNQTPKCTYIIDFPLCPKENMAHGLPSRPYACSLFCASSLLMASPLYSTTTSPLWMSREANAHSSAWRLSLLVLILWT